MAVISGLPEAVSSHNISEKKTRNASGRDLAYVFDSVNGTTTDDMDQFRCIYHDCATQTCSSCICHLWNFDFGRVVTLDLDRPSWWNLPHRGFPSLKKTDMTISQGRGGRTNLTAYQYQVIRSTESRDETKYGTCDFPHVLVWFFSQDKSALCPCVRALPNPMAKAAVSLIWLGE